MEKNAPHILIVTQAIRKLINKSAGDKVKVVIELDTEERLITLPEELVVLLEKNKKAHDFFYQLSYTNKKEYVQWIESAKKPQTKQERLSKTLEKLVFGLKNPSQK